jgi:hypothetical protein
MKHVKPYEIFESSVKLTKSQMDWLDKCTKGTWTLNSDNKIDVVGDFYCHRQELRDFKGVEFGEISRHFLCSDNQLTSLEGAPLEVGGNFYCSDNQLTSLEGAPQHVGGDFYCKDNNLTSLEGAPQHVGGGFYCSHNPVSEDVLEPIFSETKKNKIPYIQAVEDLWDSIPLDDQILLYRPEFKWLDGEEGKKLETLSRFNRVKNLI